MKNYDVLVIGGGHAGCEAAHASARLGLKTALLSMNPSRIGYMSCNPAIGGLGKGQIVREIDALGGIMGLNTDRSAIQYRKLNASRGPAVRSPRAQCDKNVYSAEMQARMRSTPNLTILELEGHELLVENRKILGIRAKKGSEIGSETVDIFSKAVVITAGTFLKAIMHMGFEQTLGGRAGDDASNALSDSIKSLGFKLRRLKTGTPPRIHKKSINFDVLDKQPGDLRPEPFSFYSDLNRFPLLTQVNCFITYTNAQTHEIIGQNFDKSPMFTGLISGVGPRYCPSVEDKVKRFSDKARHQIFLEPEGLHVDEIYVQGMSTSLPREVQDQFFRTIKGLENAEFIRYGYAVEYDAIDARQLTSALMSKDISGLFFAGQINGTSGYEEAAGQGLIAGVNAAHYALEKEPFVLKRSDAYIGVMIDDLVLRGTDEPYRMFSSRAEHRLHLREDNADLRLSPLAIDAGLLDERSACIFERRQNSLAEIRESLNKFSLRPRTSDDFFLSRGLEPLKDKATGEALVKRPEFTFSDLESVGLETKEYSKTDKEQVEIEIKYRGYIDREMSLMETVKEQEEMRIPLHLDYALIPGLSTEARGRLSETRPQTIGQAGRVPGITPSAVAGLMIHLKIRNKNG